VAPGTVEPITVSEVTVVEEPVSVEPITAEPVYEAPVVYDEPVIEVPVPIAADCDASYPDLCIPPGAPDLDCPEVGSTNYRVLPPDPHRFDDNSDGVGCEYP
jgi:hypothetical protein